MSPGLLLSLHPLRFSLAFFLSLFVNLCVGELEAENQVISLQTVERITEVRGLDQA